MTAAAPDAEDTPEAPKDAPGTDAFRLAPEPPKVMRLSRRALALVGGCAGIAIAGALMWALRSPSHKSPENLYDGSAGNKSEAVTNAPKDYGSIPKLGPPLPGDLGRPIVSAQQDGTVVPVPPIGQPAPPDPAQAATDEAERRVRQEKEAARASPLFGGSRVEAGAMGPAATLAPAEMPGQGNAETLARDSGGAGKSFESPERIRAPGSARIIQAGSVIPAALITGISSDLPGQVTAQVTQNVYDSPTGRLLLVPQGSRLIGEYDSDIVAGQTRVLLLWNRLILPGGASIRLDRQPGVDASGMSGLADRTNHHWGRMLRAAVVSTLLGAGAELSANGDSELIRALREGAQDTVNQSGRKLVEREIGVAPTITIRPGAIFRVIVTRDLIMAPLGGDR